MSHSVPSKILALSFLAFVATAAAESAQPAFRGEAQSFLSDSEPQAFVAPDVTIRSAVAVSSAEQANAGDFVATENPGYGNFENRPYHFTLSVSQGYDDNIYTSSFDKQSSLFTTVSLGATYKIGDAQTSLVAALNVGGAFYWDREDSFDPNISFSLGLTHVFTPRLTLAITTYLAYQSEPDFASGFGEVRRNGDYFYGNISTNLTQIFTRRISAVYSYTIGGVVYNESNDNSGVDNRIEQTFGLQLRYLLKPTVSLVGEYRLGLITYDVSDRNSVSNYVLGGVDFTLNRRLTANVKAGVQFRNSDDQGAQTSPFVESTLTYKYAERSTISWLNRYGFEESNYGRNTTRKTYRTGLNIVQGIGPRIALTAAGYYTNSSYDGNNDFVGNDDNEQTVDLSIGSTYALNRLLSFQIGYTYTTIITDNEFREYDRNRVFAGVTFSF